jgi:ribonuclease G
MKSELIIRSNKNDIDFALLKDGKLIELHKDEENKKIAVGDVFLAKVGKILSGLNAAFIDVGAEKDGFLHYHDLGPQIYSMQKFQNRVSSKKLKDYTLKDFPLEKDIDKDGSIKDVLKTGQSILVQIAKEPISTKGPRLSAEISIAGRFMVVLPFSDRISVSQKITDLQEKSRLKRLVKSIKPKGFGIILRTVAKDKKVAELDKDLQNSLKQWEAMCSRLVQNNRKPIKVLSEVNRASAILRDILNDTFVGIHVNDKALYTEIKDYLEQIAPDKASIVKLYTSDVPIFQKFGVDRQIKTSFGKTVSMNTGAYLVIEHTEALHVIDVNSGNRSNKAKSQQDTALEVNLIAATEVARQLQLRDMGGIIVVDFIDMHATADRKKLYEHLKEEMSHSRTKHKILPLSRFGLMQITRQRVREEVIIETKEKNPNSNGKVEAPITLIDEIAGELQAITDKKIYKKIALHVHPFVAAYLSKGSFFKSSIQKKWKRKFGEKIHIVPRDAFEYLQYHFDLEKK